MTMKKIIVAEDETSIREFIVINLKMSGYDIYEAENGEEALMEYSTSPDEIDILLLDIMMPIMDGLEVCKKVRAIDKNIGIILLTAKTQETDKVNGLVSGADDYITKPFSTSELIARVDAVYRRVEISKGRVLETNSKERVLSGDFTLDIRNRTLEKNGSQIDLTQVEFQILEYFFLNPGAALSRTAILNYVWGVDYIGEEKIVDVNIRRIRMKVEIDPSSPTHLITIWGIGYKWLS